MILFQKYQDLLNEEMPAIKVLYGEVVVERLKTLLDGPQTPENLTFLQGFLVGASLFSPSNIEEHNKSGLVKDGAR